MKIQAPFQFLFHPGPKAGRRRSGRFGRGRAGLLAAVLGLPLPGADAVPAKAAPAAGQAENGGDNAEAPANPPADAPAPAPAPAPNKSDDN